MTEKALEYLYKFISWRAAKGERREKYTIASQKARNRRVENLKIEFSYEVSEMAIGENFLLAFASISLLMLKIKVFRYVSFRSFVI